MDLSMGEEKIKLFIAESKLCRLATVSPEGAPHVVPIWYVVIDDEIYISTSFNSQKGKNMGADNRVSLVIDDGWRFDDFRGVSFQGTVERVMDMATAQRVGDAMAHKYFGSNRHPRYLFLRSIPDAAIYKLVPESSTSWDWEKMAQMAGG